MVAVLLVVLVVRRNESSTAIRPRGEEDLPCFSASSRGTRARVCKEEEEEEEEARKLTKFLTSTRVTMVWMMQKAQSINQLIS
ncbi:unnamed protein product [Dibothriocephalus latus]|uniref:Secreted protein n=1 Tax=Dibothriocephalus latus TaxID=60516 RepID=A0A3P7RMM8_DIBLA|nr:unnamed protein product [Dibothriocephalus latus]